MFRFFYFIVVSSLLLLQASFAKYDDNHNRPDTHAPIGVMRDHVHKKGEVMASYRYSYMKMSGLRDSNSNVSNSDALVKRLVIPLDMRMKMDMFSLMYGVTDELTISAMGSVVFKEMNHERRNGTQFKRESDGVGDTKINASYKFYDNIDDKVLFNLGLSLPTGSIDQHFAGTRLSYPMQIGSGSYELLPGLSYTALKDGYSYGGQVNASLKLNENDNGYKLGDSYNATAWIAKKIANSWSISTRLDYHKIEAIEGRDTTLNSVMIVTSDASSQDRQYLDGLIGVNYLIPDNIVKDFRLAFEVAAPLYQRFDDDMLESDYKFIFGLQKTF